MANQAVSCLSGALPPPSPSSERLIRAAGTVGAEERLGGDNKNPGKIISDVDIRAIEKTTPIHQALILIHTAYWSQYFIVTMLLLSSLYLATAELSVTGYC